MYELPQGVADPVYTRRGGRALREEGGVTPAEFDLVFGRVAGSFGRALDEGNYEAAWSILSRVAEELLEEEGRMGRPRSEVPAPTQRCARSVTGGAAQTVVVRRLLRLRRRRVQIAREGDNASLQRNYNRSLKDLARRFSSLDELTGNEEEDLAAIDSIIETQVRNDAEHRLDRWCWRMEADEKEIANWVKAGKEKDCRSNPRNPVHPQHRVEEVAEQWRQLWNPANVPDPDALLRFTD